MKNLKFNKRMLGRSLTIALVLFAVIPLCAQGGNTALTNAAGTVKGYWGNVTTILKAVGGLVGLIGGIRIYNKWQNGDHDINKELIGYGGSAVFLMIVPTFITAFFA